MNNTKPATCLSLCLSVHLIYLSIYQACLCSFLLSFIDFFLHSLSLPGLPPWLVSAHVSFPPPIPSSCPFFSLSPALLRHILLNLLFFFAMAWLTSSAFLSVLYLPTPAPFHQPPHIPNTPLYTTKSYNPPPTKTLEAAGANPVSPSADEWFKPEGPLLQQDLNANSASSWIKP